MNTMYGNLNQQNFVFNFTFNEGKEKGKNCYLVNVGKMQVLFNADNALDVVYVKYCGINISYLSKNGLNNNVGAFGNKFEGGFLYTCGIDNVSACVNGKEIHGSLHYNKASNCSYKIYQDKIVFSGSVYLTALFGSDLELRREYTVYENGIEICDTLINNGFKDDKYVLLYHTNFGYPFVQEGLEVKMDIQKSEGLSDYANKYISSQLEITKPIYEEEMVYYNYLKEGMVVLKNKDLGVSCEMKYDLQSFPLTLEWKSMVKGDYVLAIEPSTTRFDEINFTTIKPKESKQYKILFNFNKQ